MRASTVVDAQDLVKTYRMGGNEVQALRGVSLRVESGEMLSIVGASGSGKSSLMNVLGCLDRPTSGSYRFNGVQVEGLAGDRLADIRNTRIGFVFQTFNLLARSSAMENVELPLLYTRSGSRIDSRGMARTALERVGLMERMEHEPSELSGGEQQRVAIARALVTRPALVLADEPTGSLDSRTSLEIMALFQRMNREGVTTILVTHEPDIANCAQRIVELRDGEILRDEPVTGRRDAAADLARLVAANGGTTP